MKLRGPLPEAAPTPHHSDELKPGHLRLAPERIQAALEGHRGSPYASPELLALVASVLLLTERWFEAWTPDARAQRPEPAAVTATIESGTPVWRDAAPRLDAARLESMVHEVIELASFTDESIRRDMRQWAERCREQGSLPELALLNVGRDVGRLSAAQAGSGLSGEAFWFVLRHLGAAALPAFAAQLAPLIDDERWQQRVCPVCGNEPAAAALVGDGGRRHLYCDTCGMVWTYNRVRCAFCGTEKQSDLLMLNVNDKSPHHLDACRACMRYLKTVDYRKAEHARAVLLPIEDAASVFLDIMANRQGYKRVVLD